MEDQLCYSVIQALKDGATYAEARFQADEGESILLKNGSLEVSSFDVRRGISIRVIVNGAMGFAATNLLTKGNLNTLVKHAVHRAQASSTMRRRPIAMAPAELCQQEFDLRPRIGFDHVPLESRIELLMEADAWAVEAAGKHGMALPGRYISLDTWTTEKYIVSSDGTEVRLRTPRVAMDLFLMAKDGERTGQRSIQLGESAGWEGVERWDLPNRLSYEATQLTKVLSQGRAMGTERCDVVLGPELVGIVCHESSGHPSEADRMLGRESAQAGETFLDRRSLGQVIGSELVNVVDDPTLPRSFGLYPCDDEGVRARKRYLIKMGKVESLLHNRETAHDMGTTSNGSSRSVAYNREPIVRMANTYLEPGDHSFEELIADVSHGIYIRNFMEWNIDDRRFNQRYVGLEAYRIKAGRLEGMVRNPRIEMTTPALWSAVDAVGDDLSFTAAYCGKGDPVQAIPVWTGGPHLRLRDVVVGGSA